MTQIKVELMDSCCNDLMTVNAARVSFDKQSDWDEDGNLKADDGRLIRYLASHRHMTPFRHNFIMLRCKAPIFLARQLGKHQAGLSWNEVSRRYVDTPPEFYRPKAWRGKPEGSIKQGSAGDVDLPYGLLTQANFHWGDESLHLYNTLMDHNVAPEMARMVLPQSMMTEWVWSGNLLAFAHVYNERIAAGAQEEAQDFAKVLDDEIGGLAPVSWSALTCKTKVEP